MANKKKIINQPGITKVLTGIQGLDEITNGGLPSGRPTLVCGDAGAGKTMLAAEFLVRGATEYGEPGVFVMFEESAEELAENVRSLGFDLDELVADKKIILDHVHIERSEIEETGEYDLEGLFIRLGYAIDSIGAKRVVLDTLEALFAGLPNQAILRAELRRLFQWLKDRGLTAVITGERGESKLTRYGLEEYVADCVILLDHRVRDQISTRRLRIVKYRGSAHGTNEYPFLIGSSGLVVMPITSVRMDHSASTERVSLGVEKLDDLFDGNGVYRGSSILLTGSPGTGKSSLAVAFVVAACERGENAVFFSYEESADQLVRNARSIGFELGKYVKQGLLKIHATRPTLQGLEQHLVSMYDLVRSFAPKVVAIDPISDLATAKSDSDVKPTLVRLVDFMKNNGITALFTSLTSGSSQSSDESSQMYVSSLMDTWLLLRNSEYNGERNRTLFVLKSRGMGHSNQIREFLLSKNGIDLVDVYLGSNEVLTGTARLEQTAREQVDAEFRQQAFEQRLAEMEARRSAIEAQIAALNAESATTAHEVEFLRAQNSRDIESHAASAQRMSRARTSPGKRSNDDNNNKANN
ncbi:MAG: circadian clock protein KaiC [Pyrinomonadaceae bacterium]